MFFLSHYYYFNSVIFFQNNFNLLPIFLKDPIPGTNFPIYSSRKYNFTSLLLNFVEPTTFPLRLLYLFVFRSRPKQVDLSTKLLCHVSCFSNLVLGSFLLTGHQDWYFNDHHKRTFRGLPPFKIGAIIRNLPIVRTFLASQSDKQFYFSSHNNFVFCFLFQNAGFKH